MKTGFITTDGYATVPFGKHLMVIYNGQQLDVCKTEITAKNTLKNIANL